MCLQISASMFSQFFLKCLWVAIEDNRDSLEFISYSLYLHIRVPLRMHIRIDLNGLTCIFPLVVGFIFYCYVTSFLTGHTLSDTSVTSENSRRTRRRRHDSWLWGALRQTKTISKSLTDSYSTIPRKKLTWASLILDSITDTRDLLRTDTDYVQIEVSRVTSEKQETNIAYIRCETDVKHVRVSVNIKRQQKQT